MTNKVTQECGCVISVHYHGDGGAEIGEWCDLHNAASDMYKALVALSSNPHLHLGDLVYQVRERELEGWDGSAVKAWSDAVMAVNAAIKKAKGEPQ